MMRIAYSVGTTSFGSFPGVSSKLNGFSTAPTNDVTKKRTRSERTETRICQIYERVELFLAFMNEGTARRPVHQRRARRSRPTTTGQLIPAAIVPHPPEDP